MLNPISNQVSRHSKKVHVSKTELEMMKTAIAVRAAQLNSRPPIIASISQLTLTQAREIFSDIRGIKPIKGQLPSDLNFYISDAINHLHSVWLIQIYRSLLRETDEWYQQNYCYITAYELYQKEFKDERISFDRFILLIRNTLFSQEVTITQCKECGSANLLLKSWNPLKSIRCPMCHLSQN